MPIILTFSPLFFSLWKCFFQHNGVLALTSFPFVCLKRQQSCERGVHLVWGDRHFTWLTGEGKKMMHC